MMATVRVFLLTYQRPALLERAVRSLLTQTFENWVCELHNDDPTDHTPGELVQRLNDPRIVYHHHRENWGAVRSFNHAYAGGSERYASILEDDNWWEPDFLGRAVRTIEAAPSAALVWSNMQVWTEEADGHWADTGRTLWQRGYDVRSFDWPHPLQAFDALHSQGAMVFRPDRFEERTVPGETPVAIIEALRERSARGELLLLSEPLANFAITRTTARTEGRAGWLRARILLVRSFLEAVDVDATTLNSFWNDRRACRPRDTGFLLLAGLSGSAALLRSTRASDWFRFIASTLRHPRTAGRGVILGSGDRRVLEWLRRTTPPGVLRHVGTADLQKR